MSLKLITAPSVEPVSLAQAKSQLRITHSAEDTLIGGYISTARETAEALLRRALCPQTWERTLDRFPCGPIKLAYAPATAIVSVKYLDANGVQQTLEPSAYWLDVDDEYSPGWVQPAYGSDWPAVLDRANVVRVRWNCGYADGACPAALQNWILLHVANLFKNREVTTSGAVAEMPFVAGLLDRYKVYD